MFGSNVIDIAIGLVSLFLLLSLIASAVNELIEGVFKKRAQALEKGIKELVGSVDAGDFVSKLYDHGLINSLFRGKYETTVKKKLPSYIPSRNFALALIDLVKGASAAQTLPANITSALAAFERVAAGDAEKLQKSVEDWYNSAMDRVSGWYKRRSQFIVLVVGLILAVVSNADCIGYAKRLSKDASLRQSVVAYAEAAAKNDPTKDTTTSAPDKIKAAISELNGIGIPIGWKGVTWGDGPADFERVMGWLLTALAVSLGAPFWFDMLNRIMVIRSTVKPDEKSGEEKAKDPSADATPRK
ncbi:hypothetical protein [Occallatibacter riparius]|uniref:Uncharacterized protein n=1 Tax=Occallatibacter riparius TaxID=1002689 RepID=A0A9J7BQA0_9BACT|nr:hypothetical protein [Occallatibacter riparius]UWZ84767.1 hypothetical protein MOP44_02250 [Occallatibacter riparius]